MFSLPCQVQGPGGRKLQHHVRSTWRSTCVDGRFQLGNA